MPGYCPEKQKSLDLRRKFRSLAACPGLVLAAWAGFLAVFWHGARWPGRAAWPGFLLVFWPGFLRFFWPGFTVTNLYISPGCEVGRKSKTDFLRNFQAFFREFSAIFISHSGVFLYFSSGYFLYMWSRKLSRCRVYIVFVHWVKFLTLVSSGSHSISRPQCISLSCSLA